MNHVYGLDLSLTRTGIAGFELEYGGCTVLTSVGSKTAGGHIGERVTRVMRLADQIVAALPEPGYVVVEGASYGSQFGQKTERAGLFFMVCERLLRAGFRITEAPPAVRAKYATGNGRAEKRAVMEAITMATGVRPGNADEADALVLAALGARSLGHVVEFDDETPADVVAYKNQCVVEFADYVELQRRRVETRLKG